MFNGGNFTGRRVNVNTRGETFWGDEAKLDVSLWNNSFSFKITPSIGVDARGMRQYETDPNRILTTSVRFENIPVLIAGIDDKLVPAENEKSAKEISFLPSTPGNREGTRKLPRIGYDPEKDTYYFAITADINDSGVGTEANTLTFYFEKKPYIVDYDLGKGGGEEVTTSSDFMRFYTLLRDYHRVVPMEHHGKQYNASFQRPQNGNMGQHGGYNAGFQQNAGFAPPQPQGGQAYNAPMTSFDGSLDDLSLPF